MSLGVSDSEQPLTALGNRFVEGFYLEIDDSEYIFYTSNLNNPIYIFRTQVDSQNPLIEYWSLA